MTNATKQTHVFLGRLFAALVSLSFVLPLRLWLKTEDSIPGASFFASWSLSYQKLRTTVQCHLHVCITAATTPRASNALVFPFFVYVHEPTTMEKGANAKKEERE